MTQGVPNPKVLLFGVGSIGAVYLHQLQNAGCRVTAVCRSNYDAVRKSGFQLNSVRFGNIAYRPDHVVRDVAETTETFDYIVVCSKSFPGSKPSLADMLRPALQDRPDTVIVLAQNGIMIEEEVAVEYPMNPLISGVIYCPAYQTEPGIIEYPEMLNMLELGTYPSNAPTQHKAAAHAFADLMKKGGGEAEVHDDIQICRWSKLIMNVTWNPICALTMCTDGKFLTTSNPYAYEMVWDTMMEIVELAQAVGITQVTEDIAKRLLQIATRRAKDGTGREPSMLQDVRLSRPLEVEAIVGNAVRIARSHNLKLTRVETIYALIIARSAAIR